MKEKYGKEYLFSILDECVSSSGDAEATLAWIDEIGIHREGLAHFSEFVGKAAIASASLAKNMAVDPAEFLSAVFMSGFEVGVRFTQRAGEENGS